MIIPYKDSILLEVGDAAFNPATDIKEMFELGGMQPGGGDTFGLESAEAALVYLIDWRKRRAFTRWAIGFAYGDKGAPFNLHRENPQSHPAYPKLIAQTVHLSSVAPKANDEESGAPETNSPNYPAVFIEAGTVSKMGYYDSVFATVRYTRKDYDIRPDEYVTVPTDELDRNCVISGSPEVSLLTAEGGVAQVMWVEGGGALQPSTTAGQNVVNNSFAVRVSKVKILLELYAWPENYLSNDTRMFFPEKIYNCVGKVNSTPFLGKPAGTLLMDAPKVQRFQFPVTTFDNLGAFFGVNLVIPLTYFNPTLGVLDTDPTNNNKPRGHRCLPYSASTKWWGVKREDQSDPLKQWLLEEADFNTMLEHIAM